MGELDDAVARIRGPRIDDFFSSDANQSFGPQPAMDPAALSPIDDTPESSPEATRTWGQTGAHYGALGLRLAASMAPRHLRPLATTAVEGWSETLDYADTGEMPSWKRGAANVAFGNVGIPGIDKLAPTPVRKFLVRGAENIGLTEAYKQTAYRLGFGAKPTLKGAIQDAPVALTWTGAFQAGAHLVNAAHQRHADALDLHVKAATDPQTHGPALDTAEREHETHVTTIVGNLDPDSPAYAAQAKALGTERLSPELRTVEGVDAEYEKMVGQSQSPTGFRSGYRLSEAGIGEDATVAGLAAGAQDNASGESAASVEALNRQKSEVAQGIQRLRVDGRSGKTTPLIGPEAVDARPGPHDLIVTEKGGKRQVVAAGEKVTTAGRVKALRPGQAGELRLSLVTDAMFKAARGVKSLKDYTEGAVAKWGEHVRPFLSGAWREGSAEAAKAKRPGPAPEPPKAPIDADLMTRIDAKAAAAQTRRGWTDPKVKARLEATEKSTTDAIMAAKGDPNTPEANAKQTERMLRLKAITHERAGEVDAAKDAWRDVTLAKKANAKGQHGDVIAIGKRHGLTTREVHETVDQYTDPTDRANALRLRVQHGESVSRLFQAGVRWNFLGTLRVPVKIAYINATTTGLRALATVPAAGYSRLMHRGNQHVFANELPPSLVGYFHGLPHGAIEALDIIKNGLTKEALVAGKYGQEFHSGSKIADTAVNLPARLLGATDHLFIQPWAEAETQALMSNRARARGIQMGRSGTALTDHVAATMERWTKQPPRWALEFKARTAKRMSDSAALGKHNETLVKIGNYPVIGHFMRPFVRTIINNARRTAQTFVPGYGVGSALMMHRAGKTPAGAEAYGTSIGWGAGEGTRAQQSGAFQREEAMRAGENVVGTLFTALMVKAVLSGSIIGSAPQGMSSSERDQLGQERPWRSAWGQDANTILGPAASAGMALADAIGTYQHLTKMGEDPKKAHDTYDKLAMAAGAATMDLVKGIPLLDNQGQLGMDSILRSLAQGVPFAPAIAKNVNAMRGAPVVEAHGVKDIFKSEVLGRTAPFPERRGGLGEPIPRRGVINPFSASPTHPNEARTNAARLDVQVPMPRTEFVKTYDGKQLKLPVPVRRIADMAFGKANSLALDYAHKVAKDQDDAHAKERYKETINTYHAIVTERLQAAATRRRTVTIESLTAGLR